MNRLSQMTAHIHALAAAALDADGAMWPSVLDPATGAQPAAEHVPQRVYRLIGAPRGSTLYWDQPLVTAAHALSSATGDPAPARAAEVYVAAFLRRCVAEDGTFRWGNHAYYDVVENRVVAFSGGYHELRPITPDWERFWRLDPEATTRYLRTVAPRHVYDPETGGFNRHDDGKRDHAFLESGGILSESLAWLAGRTGEAADHDLALRIARYSHGHRHPATGLIPNEPDHGRWDSEVSTSEIGLWAGSLLRAGDATGDPAFRTMAADGLRAWLQHAWDPSAGCYAGQVVVATGEHRVRDEPGYWPRAFADPWNTDQWPTHDYPVAVGEACLALHDHSGEAVFAEGARRLAGIVVEGAPGRTGRAAYAEHYGQAIRFLLAAGRRFGDAALVAEARALADEAVARLWHPGGVFVGGTDLPYYEAVDGVGWLFLALLALEEA